MGDYAYLSLDTLKGDLGLGSAATAHDARLRDLLESVSEAFDAFVERTFRVYLATRYYTARRGDALNLDDDLLAVTALRTLTANSGGTRTYGDTWATTDYDLVPDNAATRRRPYTGIVRNPEGDYTFPTDRRGVELVGKWGFWERLETLSTTLGEALDTSETGVDVGDGSVCQTLDTVLIDSEQMYVTGVSGNTLTVVRAVNGTAAAAHASGAAMYRYRYLGPVADACGLQAARLFNRARNSPLGVQGSPEVGIIRPVRLDADIKGQIEPYRYGRA